MNIQIILKSISLVADFITIILAMYGIIFGLLKKTKSLTGFKINYYASKIFRIFFIIFILCIILFYFSYLLFFINNNFSSLFLKYILYFLIVIIVLLLFWLIVPIFWTSSFAYTFEFINLFLYKKIETDKFKNKNFLRIDKATYGKDSILFDVTEKLKQMVINNTLKITASNDLAGDPKPGTVKELIIEYTINGISKKEVINEHETKIIPS